MKIHIIFTGGTIGSMLQSDIINTAKDAPRALLARYRDTYGDRTEFSYSEPYALLSENLTFSHLLTLRDAILKESATANALIVTHGTDTLAYTAAALSYLLGLCPVPVVLVSANYVLSDIRTNGIENFAAALAFLRQTPNAKGVFVAYQNKGESTKIHRGARLLSQLAPTDEIRSLDGVVATVESNAISYCRNFTEKRDERAPFLPRPSTSPAVLPLKVHPCMQFPTLTKSTDAILLETYHSGTLPTVLEPFTAFCKACHTQGIPIFAAGITGEAMYHSATLYRKLNIIALPRMSPVAAYMKIYLALASGEDPKNVLLQSLGGDL